jgi:hypothetical protein
MNPITGRKDILHLVHPGGTPRSRTKKGPPARPVSQPIGVPSAAAAESDAPEQCPSKDSPAWAIAAPNASDAIGTDMLEVPRDSSSAEDSPQFVIAANAAPNAWPALSELVSNTDTLSDRASLNGGNRRPSAKDVVTGTASANDTTTKEGVHGTRMLPLAAPGRSRFGIRGVVVNSSAPLQSSSSRELQEDEHALSTMPSTELLGSRARLDLCAYSSTESPRAAPESPSAMMPASADCNTVFSASVEPLRPAAGGVLLSDSQINMPAPAPEHVQLQASTAEAPAHAHAQESTRTEEPAGERVLSALDLLPASLEDALDGRASLPTTAQVEECSSSSPTKAASYPATPALAGLSNNSLSGILHPSGRKQSRFAFVNNDGAMCTSSNTSFSLPKDLDHLTDAPAFRPGSALMPSAQVQVQDAPDMNGHAHHSTGLNVWEQAAAADEHAQALKQYSLPLDAMSTAQHLLQQQQQVRVNPAGASGLEHPPMTHESVVQAVSAQLQQIMSQGGHPSAITAAASRMMPTSTTAGGVLGGMTSATEAWQPQMTQKPVPLQGRQEQVHNTGIQLLQALLQQQQQQEYAAAGMHDAAAALGMSHPSAAPVSQAAARQGLAIKRPPQPPKPMPSMSMGSGMAANMYQQHSMSQRNFVPQRAAQPLHDSPHSVHHVSGNSHGVHQGGVSAASLAMQRGMQYGQLPASVGMVDPAMHRARALQHHMAQYGGNTSYLADSAACGYSNWDAAHDTYNAMLSGPQMHARQMSATLGNWQPRGHGWE